MADKHAGDAKARMERQKPAAGEAPAGAERPSGAPQPAHPDHRQPHNAPGETRERPEETPGWNPNKPDEMP